MDNSVRNHSFLIMFVVLVVISFSVEIHAKDLFVATSGSDSVSYDGNSLSTPWQSPLKAWSDAKAGDIAYFRGGTYDITEPIVTKYLGENGVDGAPITFTSYPDEEVVFTTSNLTWYVFGIQRSYNHVSNINFQGTAATWFYLGEDVPADHFEIRNCKVKLGTGGDNTGFVKSSSRADYLVVEYCTVEGPGLDVHHNTSCLYVGSADYLMVKNNTLYNAPIGIYFKTDNDEDSGNEIAYNYIYNTSRNSIQTNSQYTNFHDNIIGQGCGSFQINEGNGFALGDNNIINHNIIMSGGLVLNTDDGGANDNMITNNIISNYSNCCSGNVWNYNIYISGGSIGLNDLSNTSPTFIVTNPSVAGEYTLTVHSDGYHAGSDGNSIGVVNASIVGDTLLKVAKPAIVNDFK